MRAEQAPTRKAAKKEKALDPMEVRVSEVMTKRVKTVRPDTNLDVAMGLMMAQDIGHLPVVDEEGKVVGILSKTDVVRRSFIDGDTDVAEVRLDGIRTIDGFPGGGFHEDTRLNRTVSESMSRPVRTVAATAPLAEAAISMSKFRVHGLPVVSAENELVGFLSTFDIVDWVARR
jgi:CBS domain-containing protein